MKHFGYIPKNYLMLISGMAWILAGFFVIKTGITIISQSEEPLWWTGLMAGDVFLVFYWFIFSRLVKKHTIRISNFSVNKLPFYCFFDIRSYIIMVIMIVGGILLRKFEVFPVWFIAFFYPGLGFALFSCGVKFFVRFLKKKVLK